MKTFLFSLLFICKAFASDQAKIESVNFKNTKGSVEVEVLFDKAVTDIPKVSVRDKFVQLAISETEVWPKIEKSVTTYKPFDTKVMAYQFDKQTTRVRAIMPHEIKVSPDDIRMVLGKKRIVFNIPKDRALSAASPQGRYPAIDRTEKEKVVAQNQVKKESQKEASSYDESYLTKLLKEKDEELEKSLAIGKGNDVLKEGLDTEKPSVKEDQVKSVLAAPEKSESGSAKGSSNFSFMTYIGKYVAFLALVVLLFYGVMSLMRKGVLKKGKLGFLNSTKVVEVLNTTYIGPKRSLLLVKAHDQVFLVGSSEKGINLIHEVKDVAGLLKEGEKEIAGDNFDLNLGNAGSSDKEFNLKEDIRKAATNSKSANELTKDTVKLSDQIKSKVKNLKSLQ